MPEQQPTHHHCSACVAYGVQDWETLQRTIRMDSEDRTFVHGTHHEAGCATVKAPWPSGRETDAFEGLAEPLSYRTDPLMKSHTDDTVAQSE